MEAAPTRRAPLLCVLALALALPAAGLAAGAPAFKTGSYVGKTSPVFLDDTTGKIRHVASSVSLLVEPTTAAACDGHGSAPVLCLTNGLNQPFAEWDTEDVGGGEQVCGPPAAFTNGVNAGFMLEKIVPKSGIVMIDEKTPGDAEHVSAKFVVHKTGVVTGSLTQVVNVSNASTNGKTEPLCTTGAVTFTARFVG